MDAAVKGSNSYGLEAAGSDRVWLLALAATIALLVLINPLGFIGGGWDDWQYLTAARCWVEHGPCLPRTHWEGRWPVFVPIAGIFALAGESRASLSIWPLAASTASALLLAMVGNKALGRPVGWVAAILFVATPAFSIQLLAPSVEALELALILGGAYAALRWHDHRSFGWALCAGLCFGLAFQVRETSVIAAGLAALWVARKKPKVGDLLAGAIGFVTPLAIELLTFAMATGDPLFRRRLSVAHTQIPSSELLGPIDTERPPFFNPAYIANWKHQPGLHIHWAVDGLANLFVNSKMGLGLWLIPLLTAAGGDTLATVDRRRVLTLYGVAILVIAILIYALAVDPKARMMFVPLSLCSLSLAVLTLRYWANSRRLLISVALAAHMLVGLVILLIHQQTHALERPAAQWIERFDGQIEIDANTRRHLALVPAAERLPGLGADKEYLIYNSVMRCHQWLSESQVERKFQLIAEKPISMIGQLSPEHGGALCLLRYRVPTTADEVRSAIRRSRPDGRYLEDRTVYSDR